jgi:hypothetical protein
MYESSPDTLTGMVHWKEQLNWNARENWMDGLALPEVDQKRGCKLSLTLRMGDVSNVPKLLVKHVKRRQKRQEAELAGRE